MSVNPLLLQKIMRENNANLQEFSRELTQWREEMQHKEAALRGSTEASSSTSRKVRKLNKEKTSKADSSKPPSRIGTTDYSAWEKFDVDAELERLDEDRDDDSELTDEHNESMYDEAIVEKEKGNKFVKIQNWDEAIKCYTKAIDHYSFDPVFYANRALCYLKKNKFEDAERDCNLSLKLDPTYVKAYQRRAAAKISLNKYEHAEIDLLKVLELEPKNKESLAELGKVKQKLYGSKGALNQEEQRPISKFTASRSKCKKTSDVPLASVAPKQRSICEPLLDDSTTTSTWDIDDVIAVKPINKPPHLRSPAPLQTVDIVEIIGKVEPPVADTTNGEDKKPFQMKVVARTQEDMKDCHKQISKKVEIHNLEKGTTEEMQHVEIIKKEKSLDTSEAHSILNNDECKLENPKNMIVENSSKKCNIQLMLPKNSVQFISTWKNLGGKEKYEYLKSIDAKLLPKIFVDALEYNVFSNILEVLVSYFIKNRDSVWDVLESLTHVKRFGAMIMFMTCQDKNNLSKLIDYIKETDSKHKDTVNCLVQKYEL